MKLYYRIACKTAELLETIHQLLQGRIPLWPVFLEHNSWEIRRQF